MQTSDYIEITSTRMNPHVDPSLQVWGWEVPLYLFMGGLVAGLLFLYSVVVLLKREERYPTVAKVVPLVATPLLGLGLFFLFLDLEFKAHVLRFYTSFQFYSPMSWGAWILLLIFGVGGVQFLSTLAQLKSFRQSAIGKWKLWDLFLRIPDHFRRRLAWWSLILGIALGIYTGLLLASLTARPMWNSALIGPVFLISGLSTGTALTMLMARAKAERKMLVRFDLLLVFLELTVILMWMGALTHGSAASLKASQMLLGGPYTAVFWSFVVVVGLIVPAVLEVQSLRGRWAHTTVAPALILVGGLVLRLVLVQAGQSFGYGA